MTMGMKFLRTVVPAALMLLLAGCWSDPVRVGSKDSTENRIVAEMVALLLEETGTAVERRTRLGPTEVVFQALRNGAIDVYPDYTGTTLSLLGAPRTREPDTAYDLLAGILGEGGLVALDRLGFTSDYVLLVRPALAQRDRLRTIAALGPLSAGLRLGVTQPFVERPRDGLGPLTERFGLSFAGVEVFDESARTELYDALLDGRVDVVVGLSTDPEIADYDLVALRDASGFFPVYEAMPITAQAALDRHPEIAEVAALLAGRIDDEMMRRLNAAVRLDGRPVARVARQALFDLGLVSRAPRERTPVLGIVTEPETVGTVPAIDTLRAVRRAMRGRDVDLSGTADPLAAVRDQEARLAILPAVSAFAVGEDERIVRDERFEAVAAVGSSYLHALSLAADPVVPGQARIIASGPVGSPSHLLAHVVAAGTEAEVLPLADSRADTLAQALVDGEADVALVFAVPGRSDLHALLAARDGIVLVDAGDWWNSPARLALPVMREALIAPDQYPGMSAPVQTLSTQLILFGPAPSERFLIGQQGPGAFFEEQRPLQPQNVLAINENLGLHAAVDPHLRKASALIPQVLLKDERINPHPERAVLTLVLLLFAGWAGWLFIRPDREDG